MKYITQCGHDGLGHQLHGLFTVLILHNVKDYYVDGVYFMNKNFSFEHIKNNEVDMSKNYMTEIIKMFIEEYKQKPIQYNKSIHAHEIYLIPEKTDENTIYTLDNVFFFNRTNLTDSDKMLRNENISIMKKFFINRYLPQKTISDNAIIFHIRMGDAVKGRGKSIRQYKKQLLPLVDVLHKNYPNHNIRIHTDATPKQIYKLKQKMSSLNIQYDIKYKDTPILEVLSDFIHAEFLVCGVSSLSIVCSFLGNKKLIITHDDIVEFVNDESIKISQYIANNPGNK